MDWTQIGTNVGLVIAGVFAFFAGRGKRQVGEAADQAAVSEFKVDTTINEASQKQIDWLAGRIEALEKKYAAIWDELQAEKTTTAKLRDRVRQLEGILRDNNITVPAES